MMELTFWYKGKIDLYLAEADIVGHELQLPFAGCRVKTFLMFGQEYVTKVFISTIDEKNMIEEGKEYFSQERLDEFFAFARKRRDHYFEMGEGIQTMNMASLSNEELAKLYREYFDAVVPGLSLYHQSQHEPMQAAEERIIKILKDHFDNPREIMLKLIEPYELDDINKDEIRWLTILTEKEELTREEWESYMKRCSWNTWNSYDFDELFETYKKRFAKEKGNHRERITKIEKRKEEHKKEIGAIMKKVASDELDYLIKMFHRTTLGRMWLKPMWAGAIFLARNMFEEVGMRLGMSTETLLHSYYVDETVKALTEEFRVDDEEIARRKETFYLALTDGKLHYLSGERARVFVKKNFPQIIAPPKTTELKGTPASKGKATGRVRILVSENIHKLKEVASRFEDGDILVADMTQPASVVLMQRAGAIVTDEGGLTSHAAVVSREFGKPCVVGTHSATETFKDDDIVEVDADKGTVKKL